MKRLQMYAKSNQKKFFNHINSRLKSINDVTVIKTQFIRCKKMIIKEMTKKQMHLVIV